MPSAHAIRQHLAIPLDEFDARVRTAVLAQYPTCCRDGRVHITMTVRHSDICVCDRCLLERAASEPSRG